MIKVSEQIRLRQWKNDEEGILQHFANNPRIASMLTNTFPYPYELHHARAFIDMSLQMNPPSIFAIEYLGKPCGSAGLHVQKDVYCKNAEMGYWLGEDFWGKGIMTEVVKAMTNYGFKTLDIERIYARPYGSNTASQRVLQKSGYKLEALMKDTIFKNGEFLDEFIFAARRKDWE